MPAELAPIGFLLELVGGVSAIGTCLLVVGVFTEWATFRGVLPGSGTRFTLGVVAGEGLEATGVSAIGTCLLMVGVFAD